MKILFYDTKPYDREAFEKLAGVAELADALDLGSSAERRMSSNLFARTTYNLIRGYSVMVTH